MATKNASDGALDLDNSDRSTLNKPDPTENVRELVVAANLRSDDLRQAESRRIDEVFAAERLRVDSLMAAERLRVNEAAESLRRETSLAAIYLEKITLAESKRIDERQELRSAHSKELADAETHRIDAIRAVDVAAVATAQTASQAAANVLATQLTATADTLRALVASTASTVAAQLQQISETITTRLANLERTSYEGAGKSTRDDPQIVALVTQVAALTNELSKDKGAGSVSQPLMMTLIGVACSGGVAALLAISGHLH